MGKYRAITLMTAVQITQPPLKSPATEQSQKQEEPKPTYGFRETSGSCLCGGTGPAMGAGEWVELKDSRGSVHAEREGTTGRQPSPPSGAHSAQHHPTAVLPSILLCCFLPHTGSQLCPGLDSLNKGSRDRATAVGRYWPGLGNLLHSVGPNIFLDFDQAPE